MKVTYDHVFDELVSLDFTVKKQLIMKYLCLLVLFIIIYLIMKMK